jgi:hypothetical protein
VRLKVLPPDFRDDLAHATGFVQAFLRHRRFLRRLITCQKICRGWLARRKLGSTVSHRWLLPSNVSPLSSRKATANSHGEVALRMGRQAAAKRIQRVVRKTLLGTPVDSMSMTLSPALSCLGQAAPHHELIDVLEH